MRDLFLRAGIDLTEEQVARFSRYADLLIEYNEKFNLTAITERSDVYEKHFLDSVLAEKYIPAGAAVIDVGSGAGFPAIPLKIVRPDLRFVLLDSLNKRVGFLQAVIGELGLTGIEAIHARAEDFAKTAKRESFDAAVARAVAPYDVLAEYCLPFVKVGGIFLAYKGQNAEAEREEGKRAVRILGGETPVLHNYALPNGDKRAIVETKKASLTPAKYPRGQNKPRLSPLR